MLRVSLQRKYTGKKVHRQGQVTGVRLCQGVEISHPVVVSDGNGKARLIRCQFINARAVRALPSAKGGVGKAAHSREWMSGLSS